MVLTTAVLELQTVWQNLVKFMMSRTLTESAFLSDSSRVTSLLKSNLITTALNSDILKLQIINN